MKITIILLIMLQLAPVITFLSCNHKMESTASTHYFTPGDTKGESLTREFSSPKCTCDTTGLRNAYIFSDPDVFLNLEKLDQYTEHIAHLQNKTIIQDVETLLLNNVDYIPNILSIFSNVETVQIHRGTSLDGISIFENLRELVLIEYVGKLPRELGKLDIKVFVTEKSSLTNFQNIARCDGIMKIMLFASSIDRMPNSYKFLDCVTRFEIVQYSGTPLDLKSIDLSGAQCLKVLSLVSNKDNLYSVPKGLGDHNFIRLNIFHSNLSDVERDFLESKGNQYRAW